MASLNWNEGGVLLWFFYTYVIIVPVTLHIIFSGWQRGFELCPCQSFKVCGILSDVDGIPWFPYLTLHHSRVDGHFVFFQFVSLLQWYHSAPHFPSSSRRQHLLLSSLEFQRIRIPGLEGYVHFKFNRLLPNGPPKQCTNLSAYPRGGADALASPPPAILLHFSLVQCTAGAEKDKWSLPQLLLQLRGTMGYVSG